MKTFQQLTLTSILYSVNGGYRIDNKNDEVLSKTLITRLDLDIDGNLIINRRDGYSSGQLVKIPSEYKDKTWFRDRDIVYFTELSEAEQFVKAEVLNRIHYHEDAKVKIDKQIANIRAKFFDILNK